MKTQATDTDKAFVKDNFHKLTQAREWPSDSLIERLASSEYQMQAIRFLIETNTTCDIEKMGLSSPSWGKKRKVNTYRVTLKNSRHIWSFDFYDSIKNTEDNKSARFSFYSVLACMSYSTPESFDDFCAEFGYEFKNESEYISAKSTHLACLDQDKNLRKLFTPDHLEKLSEIQ
jgi:hypothetical protein